MKRDAGNTRIATKAVWAGEEQTLLQGATQVPIVQSVAFGYQDLDNWQQVALGQKPGHIYSRNTNPTVAALEEKMRVLEGAEAATSTASGMAAISNTLFSLLRPGDRIVTVKDTYGGTNQLFREFLPQINVSSCLCDTTDFDAIEAEIARGCRLLYLETPTNPTLKVIDIERLARRGHQVGALVITDNTFATPHQPASAAAWLRLGDPQCQQISRWARRCPGRHRLRAPRVGPAHFPLPRNHRCCPRPVRCLPPATRAENPVPARRAPERQRHQDRAVFGNASGGDSGLLSWPGIPSATRNCHEADAGRLWRHAQLRS